MDFTTTKYHSKSYFLYLLVKSIGKKIKLNYSSYIITSFYTHSPLTYIYTHTYAYIYIIHKQHPPEVYEQTLGHQQGVWRLPTVLPKPAKLHLHHKLCLEKSIQIELISLINILHAFYHYWLSWIIKTTGNFWLHSATQLLQHFLVTYH